jgi:hypothetical protein
VADDRSGSSSWSGSFTLKLFNPEARAYTADDLARYSTGGFSLFVYRGGGNAPGSLLTSSGYDWSAATFSDVDVAITTFDPASGRVAAEFSFGAVDRAGDAWTVEGRFDEVFVQP